MPKGNVITLKLGTAIYDRHHQRILLRFPLALPSVSKDSLTSDSLRAKII